MSQRLVSMTVPVDLAYVALNIIIVFYFVFRAVLHAVCVPMQEQQTSGKQFVCVYIDQYIDYTVHGFLFFLSLIIFGSMYIFIMAVPVDLAYVALNIIIVFYLFFAAVLQAVYVPLQEQQTSGKQFVCVYIDRYINYTVHGFLFFLSLIIFGSIYILIMTVLVDLAYSPQ